MKKKTFNTIISGKRLEGMTYSALAVGYDIRLGSREWYKLLHEALTKEVEDAKTRS